MAKKFDPKAKAKKQKIIAAIGGVLLLGLLAFQVPRTLKMLRPSSESQPSSTPAATSPSTMPAAAASTSVAASARAAGGDGLVDSDAGPAPQSGQLLAFGRFRTKDPFAQQLEAGATGASGVTQPKAPAAAPHHKSSTAAAPTVAVVPKPSGGSTPPAARPAAIRTVPTSAVISVDGSPQTVQVGGTFPSSAPVFKLVGLTAKTAKVGIAGGSLETGAPSVTLTKHKAVTLLNTADGTRYVLRLLSVS